MTACRHMLGCSEQPRTAQLDLGSLPPWHLASLQCLLSAASVPAEAIKRLWQSQSAGDSGYGRHCTQT
ncbi:hypothetical protein ABBQ38_012433 [Trebouxia sp. C0009 RCD-2024]